MKWLLKTRFSWLDLLGIYILIQAVSYNLWLGLIWLAIGTTLVSVLEDRYGGDDE